jgi:DNA primase catalytic subunit
MKPCLVEIKDFETRQSIIVDMEGPYHRKNERIGEHLYGSTLLIDNIPYHFEKYIPTEEEIRKFKAENDGNIQFSKGGFLYRLVPFTK